MAEIITTQSRSALTLFLTHRSVSTILRSDCGGPMKRNFVDQLGWILYSKHTTGNKCHWYFNERCFVLPELFHLGASNSPLLSYFWNGVVRIDTKKAEVPQCEYDRFYWYFISLVPHCSGMAAGCLHVTIQSVRRKNASSREVTKANARAHYCRGI